MKNTKYEVTFKIGGTVDSSRWRSTRVMAPDVHSARNAAARKLFGKRCFWNGGQGDLRGYGQVFENDRRRAFGATWSATSRTDAIVAFVEEV